MGESSVVHSFADELAYSIQAGDEPFWESVYKKAFTNFVRMESTANNPVYQKAGIDRIVYLTSKQRIKVDEKKRKIEYGDFCLEYVSVNTYNKPGWIEKDLAVDFIAYAFMQSKRVYLLQWNLLKLSWLRNKDVWMKSCRKIVAHNNGYDTYSLAVPIPVVLKSVSEFSVIHLG